ncbi:MAG TPA: DUF502 domain-containing protein, partial [Verrucomicrobiae bacterium]|nr:DUF502 domain-containing protein [Verrucomicrobiae bacterium]
GLLIVAPAVVTSYALLKALAWVDGLIDVEGRFGFRVPGLGALAVFATVTATGFVASNILMRYFIDLAERIFRRLPLVRLVYRSIQDLVGAFVGEKKRFDRPVLVTLVPHSDIKAVGFVTRTSLEEFDMPDHVAVYFPSSFNFAGHLVVLPRERTTPLRVDSTTAMAFIISGGVSGEAAGPPRGVRGVV